MTTQGNTDSKVSYDDLIIKVLRNAWDSEGNRVGDAWLTTSEIARAIGISNVSTLKHLKKLQLGDKIKGVQHGTWLWRWKYCE